MPGYVKKILTQFKHDDPKRPQYSPCHPLPHKYGKESQETLPQDTTTKINAEGIKLIHQVVGEVLYYARAVDCTILAPVSSIAMEQSQATEGTEKSAAAVGLLTYTTRCNNLLLCIITEVKHSFGCILPTGSQSCWVICYGGSPQEWASNYAELSYFYHVHSHEICCSICS